MLEKNVVKLNTHVHDILTAKQDCGSGFVYRSASRGKKKEKKSFHFYS
jgi:hypothetical protein